MVTGLEYFALKRAIAAGKVLIVKVKAFLRRAKRRAGDGGRYDTQYNKDGNPYNQSSTGPAYPVDKGNPAPSPNDLSPNAPTKK
ncbi:MAG: hypothetical protein M1832_004493 [Thelocarpon impressellum]|nr:MAG: hypothetical protein M1832_004493 [Thelocarpon impressellum]